MHIASVFHVLFLELPDRKPSLVEIFFPILLLLCTSLATARSSPRPRNASAPKDFESFCRVAVTPWTIAIPIIHCMAREGNGDRRAGDQYDEAPEVNSKRHRYPLESRCCRSRDEKQVKLRKERTEIVRSQAQRRPSGPSSCIARMVWI